MGSEYYGYGRHWRDAWRVRRYADEVSRNHIHSPASSDKVGGGLVMEKYNNCMDCRKYGVCWMRRLIDEMGIDYYIHFHDCDQFDPREGMK